MRRFFRDYFYVLGNAGRTIPWIVGLLLFSAALDVFSLGLIAPLIAVVTGSGASVRGTVPEGPLIGSRDPTDLTALLFIAALVIVAFASKGAAAYVVQRTITRFSESRRRDLMTRLLSSYLAQSYERHLDRNSATLVTTVLNYTAAYAGGILGASLRLCADVVMLLAIVAFLAWTSPTAVGLMVFLLGITGYVYYRSVRIKLHRIGTEVATASEHVVRTVMEALGPLREVKVLGIAPRLVRQLDQEATRLAEWSALGTAVNAVPRYLIETAMVSFIVLLGAFAVLQGTPADTFIPTVGVFGVAAMRLMPTFTAIMSGLNTLRQSGYVLTRLADDLRGAEADAQFDPQLMSGAPPLTDFRELRFEGVTYTYPNAPAPSVVDLSFTIRAGAAIGLIGKTGSGKSTVADLLLGLLHPQAGRIAVDGCDIRENLAGWQRQLAYIPQAIYLIDDTFRRNIAFGVPDHEVDPKQLAAAVEASQLAEVIAQLPAGLDTVVGERGVRLSGGQRQRVALARALYHNRKLIVMDEATSALDTETEREVTRAIGSLHGKTTLIIIAHRLSTLEGCEHVLKLEAGRLLDPLIHRTGAAQR